MTPFQFLRTPRLWFDAITQFKGTLSAAPNFAYGMMARKFNPADLPTVDLSSWRVAVCGAEPIDTQALRSFAAQFKTWFSTQMQWFRLMVWPRHYASRWFTLAYR